VVEVLYFTIPLFVLLLVVELLSFQYLRDDDLIGYEARDTRTSLTMGAGNVVINAGWKLVVLIAYAGLYELTPLRMPVDQWWTYGLLFFAEDLAHYWWHRVHHEVRFFWASHVVHHSSEHYNLSTALRQPWTPMTALPFWAPLALLGFAPWMIFLQISISQVYQFWIHTERVSKLPAWYEFFFNTPSHHRVHHGANEMYLDRNYGSTLIVWDRVFGTYQDETERARYGLTKNISTFQPARVAFHEFAAIARDVRAASSWRDRLGYLFRGPGWAPDGEAAPAVKSSQR
jgi:sterol desaturase/sphingolipid hydroxylase (fatty acid hydroxylase superfamily)